MYAVKVKRLGAKRWDFLSSGGRTNGLRVHAVQFPTAEAAQAFVDTNSGANAGFAFKVVDLEWRPGEDQRPDAQARDRAAGAPGRAPSPREPVEAPDLTDAFCILAMRATGVADEPKPDPRPSEDGRG